MARNGSGTYSLPVAPFTPGTTISSSDVNSDFSDIATALTGSIAADGQTAITGQLKGALGTAPTYSISGDLNTGFGSSTADTAFIQCGGANVVSCTTTTATILALVVTNASTFNSTSTFNNTITLATAAINETSTTLASASTVNIGAAAANYIFISGTVTITAFDTVASGIERTLEFQGALTLTYNATTLILPGSATITTAAGDTAIFRSEGSGNWRCISYVRRAVPPIGIAPTVQVFSASGTYTPRAGLAFAIIECVGSGGSGAGGVGTGTTIMAGSGGGAGGYSRAIASAATIGASQTVTINAAGAAPAAGNNAGNSGGSVSFGALCIANGGSGGSFVNNTPTVPLGGTGGIAGTGNIIAATGASGGGGLFQSTATVIPATGGAGASSIWGQGGRSQVNASAGQTTGAPGAPYGAGGSGGYSNQTAANFAGGSGATGYVIVTEY